VERISLGLLRQLSSEELGDFNDQKLLQYKSNGLCAGIDIVCQLQHLETSNNATKKPEALETNPTSGL